jgi:hypothetical protein
MLVGRGQGQTRSQRAAVKLCNAQLTLSVTAEQVNLHVVMNSSTLLATFMSQAQVPKCTQVGWGQTGSNSSCLCNHFPLILPLVHWYADDINSAHLQQQVAFHCMNYATDDTTCPMATCMNYAMDDTTCPMAPQAHPDCARPFKA